MTATAKPDQLPTPVRKRGNNVLHEKNPFMMDIKTRTKRTINKRGNMMMITPETGEINGTIAGFWEAQVVDSTRFVKLFIKGVSALTELTSAGTKVFELLYLRVQEKVNNDKIYLSFSLVDQNITPMSEATYSRGMRELIEKGFLAASPNIGLYWLNPSYLWNGDRLAFVQQYVREDAKKTRADLLTQDLFALENNNGGENVE